MKIIFVTLILCFCCGLFSNTVAAKTKRHQKIIYKYKKYQKFDFEALGVSGDAGAPGDLSIRVRKQKGFNNKLPFRRNFNSQMRRAIERIR